MNCTYRSIWNDTSGTFVAVSENAKSAGKRTSSGTSATGADASFVLKALAISVMLSCGANVYALPAGGVVAAGGASISSAAGNTTIQQSTQNAAINWQSFNIAAGEAVRFVQPNSNSVALNRVLGSDPSSILGSLSANGKVFLVNPNGILFGKGASVNVGGLVASTLNITNSDFMAGNYKFSGAGQGTILNQGSINADGGYVALLGANVSNDGVISAKLGTVALAAGNAMTLDVAGDGLLNVTVNQGAVDALVQNGGLIRADGGQVLLSAQSAGKLLQSAVNNTGVIQALSVENHNGTIRLLGDMQSGTVSVAGTLDVSGMGAGQTGGSVTVTGHHVGLFGGHINASGDAGGGTVLIGGDYQGKNPNIQNAAATYMSADATISADAGTNGSGGKVVLWANDSTRAYGSITARGGAQSGNGGLIETSGHWLDVVGINVNASAPNGTRGMWLLDPADVTIGAGTTNASLIGNVYTPASGVNTATVDAGALRTALEAGGGTDITITTTNSSAPGTGAGNITVAAALTYTPTTSATLTLSAAGDVNINAAITTTRGNLVVCCGQDVNVNAKITTTNGSVLLSAGRDVNIVRAGATPLAGITTTDGNIELCSGRDINLSNTFDGAALMTLTRGSVTAGQSLSNLGVLRGLTLMAGTAGTGPGAAGGTVAFTTGTYITTTGPDPVTPTNIFYNPSSYTAPTNYSTFFTGDGGPLTQYMLVFPDGGGKTYDGTTLTTFNGLKGTPAGVTLNTAGGTANFDSAAVGTGKTVSFTGFTLTQAAIVTGGTATNFALPVTCCAPIVGKTTAAITPAPLTVTASNVTKTYGQAPLLSGFGTTGLVNGETVGSVTETSPGQPATASVVGSPYAITPSSATGGTFTPSNYTITYVNGVLTVTPVVVPPVTPVVVLPVTPVVVPTVTPTVAATSDTAPEEMLGVEQAVTPLVVPPGVTAVVLAKTPPELLTLMPEETPPLVPPETPVVVPVPPPPEVYVAPPHQRKQDRN